MAKVTVESVLERLDQARRAADPAALSRVGIRSLDWAHLRRGRTRLTLEKFLLIAEALGVEPADLLRP